MRRSLILVLVACLLGGALAAPATAKKKQKKKKPPVTFEAEGSFAIANPSDFAAETGLTRNEFLLTCSLPASQGLDGFVVELDDAISKKTADVTVRGSDATGMYDLDMYFFDEACLPKGSASTAEENEFGVFPAGTRYVLVSAFLGADIEFTLTAKELR